MNKIVVVGTGYIGLPAALMWAKSGLKVIGVDINENIVRAINERTMLINETKLMQLFHDDVVQANLTAQSAPSEGDVFVIAVPTPVDSLKKVADMSYIESALESICPLLKTGNLVVIESTIPPMTCRNFVKPFIEKHTSLKVPDDILLSHCPERILPGDIFAEIINNDRLIGGLNHRSTEASISLYKYFVQGNLLPTTDIIAEISKLVENTYRDVNIALANEISLICEDLSVDPLDVIALANRHPRVNVLTPGIGVGGHCIPIDPWFLKEIAPYHSHLISMARWINDSMPRHVAAKIRKKVSQIHEPKIVALGAAYKKNCEDIRESPAIEIVNILKEDGYDIKHFDPLVVSMSYSRLEDIIADVDRVVVLVSHDKIIEELTQKHDQLLKLMRHGGEFLFFDNTKLK